jgi:predicted DNA-binding transcriptional regulator AlpA
MPSILELQSKPALTLKEVAELTGFSRQTVTRIFEDEPGVLVFERAESMHRKKHRTITVPRPVFERVIERLRKK